MSVSQAYLLGIEEGRAYLKAAAEIGVKVDPREQLANCKRVLRHLGNSSNDLLECIRGQRDFWANQVKLLET